MTIHPKNYVKAALLSLGVKCRALKIEDYDPLIFGNFAAIADTDMGMLRILYDREFFVELEFLLSSNVSSEEIVPALSHYRQLTVNDN